MSVKERIQHYQRSIEKYSDNEERVLYCISKLYNLPVTVELLAKTGVGRTVNNLKKYKGTTIADAARGLVAKWKTLVHVSLSPSREVEKNEAYISDAPETYNSDNNMDEDNNEGEKSRSKKSISLIINENDKESNTDSNEHYPSTSYQEYYPKQKTEQEAKYVNFRINGESSKIAKPESERSSKHEKNKHSSSSKHESKYESKHESKNESKIDKKYSSKDSKMEQRSKDSVSVSSKSHRTAKEEGKRKHDGDDERKNKKIKNSSFENEKNSCSNASSSDKRTKQSSNSHQNVSKIENKYEKIENTEEKHGSSSKLKSESHCNRTKDDNRHKHRTNEIAGKSKNSSLSKDHSSRIKYEHKEKDSKGERKDYKADIKEEKDKKSEQKKLNVNAKGKHDYNTDEEIDCKSGATFAEALDMCYTAPSKKRSKTSSTSSATKTTMESTSKPVVSSSSDTKKSAVVKEEPTCSSSDLLDRPALLGPNVKLAPLNVDLASTLPEISPNYKPLPIINPNSRKDEEKILNDLMYVKNQRTKVYSGNKTGYTSVPSLYELCIRVLIENIEALEFTGGVPYDIIKPVLERATPDQLFMLEHYNPYLIEDTDCLWQFHCTREFRNKQREEMESWREMYMRCLDEREAKLKTLTANIKQSIDKSLPVRSTKLAYVDHVVKPPRNVLKKQAKYGTANAVPNSTSDLKKRLAGGGSKAATNIAVPPPPMARGRMSSSGVVKKTKAPLMAKALQLIKGRYRR